MIDLLRQTSQYTLRCAALSAMLLMSTVFADAPVRMIEFSAFERVYRLEVPELSDPTIVQSSEFVPAFRDHFQVVGDLTPTRVHQFLTTYPNNRDAVLSYVLSLPDSLLRDAVRLSLVHTLIDFDLPSSKTIPFILRTPRPDSHPPTVTSKSFNPSPMPDEAPAVDGGNQTRDSASNQSIQIERTHTQSDPGFGFRFYRGLQLEYQFDSQPALSIDVWRQRVEVEWVLD